MRDEPSQLRAEAGVPVLEEGLQTPGPLAVRSRQEVLAQGRLAEYGCSQLHIGICASKGQVLCPICGMRRLPIMPEAMSRCHAFRVVYLMSFAAQFSSA